MEKLNGFGFSYQESIFDKNTKYFYVSYPQKPYIIGIIKIYMNCWNDVLVDEYLKSEIKRNGYGCLPYYFDFYLFDYKVTANPQELKPLQIIKDKSYFCNKDRVDFYLAFYEYSKKYSAIRFSDGNYYIKKNRVVIFWYNDRQGLLKLKLKNPNKYITALENLPKNLQECFSNKAIKCHRCGCLGNNPDICNNRILWKLNDIDYIGCSMDNFYLHDIKIEDIPHIFSLLEHEYGLKKNSSQKQKIKEGV